MIEDIDMDAAHVVIERIAKIAEQFSDQAGIGGMETAGKIISYLADHPRDVEPLLRFGVFELPADWFERGRLTYHAVDGKVRHPVEVRRARVIKKLEKSA